MQGHPEGLLGSIFQIIEVGEDSVALHYLFITNFDLVVVEFGQNKVFEILEKSMKPTND